MRLLKLFITGLLILVFSVSAMTQVNGLDPAETGEGLMRYALKDGKNIKFGSGFGGYIFDENGADFLQKYLYSPNTFSYYVAFNRSKQVSGNIYFNWEFQIGQRHFFTDPHGATDTINLFNATRHEWVFLGLPVAVAYRQPIGKNMYYGFEAGAYMTLQAYNEISNSYGKRSAESTWVDGEMRTSDLGARLGVEFGFRSAFIGMVYEFTLRDMALPETPASIRNTGTIGLFAGFRFASAQGQKDAEQIRKVVK